MANEQAIDQEIDRSKEAFFATDISVWPQSGVITFDFRQTLPRADAAEGKSIPSLITKHQPVVVTPHLAKMLLIILKEQLDGIEKNVGEIKLPENWRVTGSHKDKGASVTESYIR